MQKEIPQQELSKKEKEQVKKLDKMTQEMRKYRSQNESEWDEFERFYKGDQWANGVKRPFKNLIFQVIEGEVPILVDSSPGTDVIAVDGTDYEAIAKQLEASIKWTYEKNNLDLKLTQAVRNSLKSCCGWIYVGYDHEACDGEGMTKLRVLPWQQVLIDPMCNDIDEAGMARIAIPMRVDELKRMFPAKAKFIRPMKSEEMTGDDKQNDRSEDRHYREGQDSEVSRYQGDDITLYEEYWYKDYSMEKIPTEQTAEELQKEQGELRQGISPEISRYENHEAHIQAHSQLMFMIAAQALQIMPEQVTDGDMQALMQDPNIGVILTIIDDHLNAHDALLENNPKGEQPKYKNNWRLTIKSGNVLLFDGEPDEDHGMIPLAPVYCYIDTDSPYGFGEIKNIINIQKSYNDMDFAEYSALRLNANGGWVVDNNSGVDESTLTNEEGIVITKNQGTEVQRLQPGTVSPQYQNRKEADKLSIQEISGIREVTQGETATGVTAAKAIKKMAQQAVGRIRLKTKYLEMYTMPRIGRITASNNIQYWSTERKLKVYDANGQMQFIKYDPAMVRDLKYEIRMVPGTTAGLDKESWFDFLSQMVQGGIMPPEALLTLGDVPQKDKLMEFMQVADQKNMAIEQLTAENEELKGMLKELGV